MNLIFQEEEEENATPILKPCMKDNEIELLKKYLCGNYVEFGSGGSTYLAYLNSNIKTIYTIESSQKWIDYVSNIIKDQDYEKITYCYVDINADDENWGYPKDNSKRDNWKNYYNPWSNIKNNIVDIILIDGRFRVACSLFAWSHMNDDSVLLIHDYKNRPWYHIIEQFFELVEYVETLAVFKRGDRDFLLSTFNHVLSIYIEDPR